MLELDHPEKLFDQRESFLKSLVGNASELEGDRLIKRHLIQKSHFINLQAACFNYLVACLVEHGSDIEASLSYDEFVLKNSTKLTSMANVTPNGVIRPKKETIAEFNAIHHVLSKILATTGLNAQKARAPISMRIVTSHDDQTVLTRPRANNKLHSDFWTGAVCDFAVLIPVFGDLGAVDVVFGEPEGMSIDFLQELTDYSSGAALYDTFREYPTVMEKGYLFLQDIFCLHGTRRQSAGCRVSIDFTVQSVEYENTIKPFYSNTSLRTDNHIDYEQWRLIGQNNLIYETESIEALLHKNDYQRISGVIGKGAAIKHQTSKTLRLINMETFTDLLQFESKNEKP